MRRFSTFDFLPGEEEEEEEVPSAPPMKERVRLMVDGRRVIVEGVGRSLLAGVAPFDEVDRSALAVLSGSGFGRGMGRGIVKDETVSRSITAAALAGLSASPWGFADVTDESPPLITWTSSPGVVM